MRLAIVVEDFGQIFAGHADCIWEIVIAGRDNNLSGAAVMDVSLAIGGGNVKTSVFAIDGLHPVVLVDLQIVVLCGSAVVLKSFLAGGLDERTREGDVANLQEFRRCEEGHVGRIVENRIDEAALVENERLEASLLRFNGAC